MNDEEDVTGSSPEEVVEESKEETPAVSEDEKTPASAPVKPEEKTVPYSRFKKVNEELTELKAQPPKEIVKTTLGIEDYIDISASLEGLDHREKEYLAKEHKLTGKPLAEIRKDEDFGLWQEAYRAKVEKEKLALKPSGTQSDSDKPLSFAEKLSSSSVAEKEKILTEAGLYRSPRPRSDRVDLGRGK